MAVVTTTDERLDDERLMEDLRQHDRRIYEQGVRDGRAGHDVRYVEDVRDDRLERPVQVVAPRRSHAGAIAFVLILLVALAVAAAYVFMPTSTTLTTTKTSSTTASQADVTPLPTAVHPAEPAVTPPDASQGVSASPDTTASAPAPTSQMVE